MVLRCLAPTRFGKARWPLRIGPIQTLFAKPMLALEKTSEGAKTMYAGPPKLELFEAVL